MTHHLPGIWLTIFTFVLFQGCYRILPSKGGGQLSHETQRKIDPSDILLPAGYEIEVVSAGFTFPTAITFDEEGVPYIVESGYSYGEVFLQPKLLRLNEDGKIDVIASGERNGPWNGVTYQDGFFYVAEGGQLEGGKILKISRDGDKQVLVEGLPSFGDHHTNGPVVKDGYVYFGQGTATNAGVVGMDNAQFGWLSRNPEFHDIPCVPVTVTGFNYTSSNILTREDKKDKALTGPYSPYNTPVNPQQVIPGAIPCNGAIMRVPVNGGEVELIAWGLRNPYGMAFSPGGELYVTENSYDVRGSRPVWGTGDVLWKIEQGKWYGWPDFSAGIPIGEFKAPAEKRPKPVLAEHPGKPPKPVAILGVHSSSNGIAFSTETFGYSGDAFIAQFGDMAPNVGKVESPVGFKVIKVDIENGVIQDFVVNKGKKNGPASWLESGGIERPIAVQFSPDGALYIVDFGVLTMNEEGADPHQKTGVIWKVTKK